MPESGVGTSRVASAPPGPQKSIIRRASTMDDKPDLSSEASAKEEGRQLFKQNETVLTRRHEYGEAARNAGERGPRKVPEAFAQQKSRGPWPKGGNFSSRMKQSSLAGMSTAKPHGMPESGAPEKYPKLLRSKSPEARGRREATFRGKATGIRQSPKTPCRLRSIESSPFE